MKGKIKLINYKFNSINISGSKNSSLPIIAACILCDEEVILNNIPNISDVVLLIKILNNIGVNITFKNNTVIYKPSIIKQKYYNYKNITKLRGSYYIIGALIGKFKNINFSFLYPGGCKFSKRPINYHINAFKQMGINIKTSNNKLFFKGTKKETKHILDFPSVGATINILLATSKIESTSYIYNASIEPEVIDVCNFLKSMGVEIFITNRTIKIKGKSFLKQSNYTIMEDRIEAGTFLLLGALHNGIKINNVNSNNINSLLEILKEVGYEIIINDTSITLNKTTETIKPFNIIIDTYPSFPTDLGPIICVLASQINGTSTIIDKVYLNRISHVKELNKFNVNIVNYDNVISIKGKNNIKNAIVNALDLRCGASLILAASLSTNYSIIKNIENILRGYENIQEKLNNLGIEFIY